MELTFENLNGLYVAEFEVTSNCNIHIERERRGGFTISQRGTKQGKYAYIADENYDDRTTIDVDMLGNIYPKYIKITSASKPTYAEVNFAEEGGGSGGEERRYLYKDISQLNSSDYGAIVNFATLIKKEKSETDSQIEILPALYGVGNWGNEKAFALGFNLNEKYYFEGYETGIEPLLEQLKPMLGGFFDAPELTEEEFYNISTTA